MNAAVRWGVKCESARRGGVKTGNRIQPLDVDGSIRKLIEDIDRATGSQKEMGDGPAPPWTS